jgi:hypothetical protein
MPVRIGRPFLTREDLDREREAARHFDFETPLLPWWKRPWRRLALALGRRG